MSYQETIDYFENVTDSFGHALDLGEAIGSLRSGVTTLQQADEFIDFLGSRLAQFAAFLNLTGRYQAIEQAYNEGRDWQAELFAQSVELIVYAGFLAAGTAASAFALATTGPGGAVAIVSVFVSGIAYDSLAREQVLDFYRDFFSSHISAAPESDFSYASPVLVGLSQTQLASVLVLPHNQSNWASAISSHAAVLGGNSSDVIDGSGLATVVRVDGGGGNDQIFGGLSADRLIGAAGDDLIAGGAGTDSMSGGAGNDTLRGESGNDFLEGGTGHDVLIGGAGGDTFSIGLNQGSDRIEDSGGSGIDILRLFTGDLFTSINSSWFTRDGNDLLVSVPGGIQVRIVNMGSVAGQIERVELFIGNAETSSDSIDLVEIWQSLDPLPTPDAPDLNGDSDAPEPDAPSSGFTYTGTSTQDLFLGTANRDVVRGLGGVDALAGDDGDDVLLGNADPDALNGGNGDDLLVDDDQGNLSVDNLAGGAGDDSLVFYGAPSGGTDVGDGGSGQDLLLVDLTNSNDDWNLRETNGVYVVSPDEASDGGDIEVENVEIVAILFGDGDDFAHGDTGQYYFTGGGGDDQLTSEASNDYLAGEGGDDRLNGGAGQDWIDGGDGVDRATLDLSSYNGDLTYIARDAARSTGFTFENGSHVRNIERIDLTSGGGNDRIWLGDYDDTVVTGAGDDTVHTEGRGRDSIELNSGTDRLVIDFSWSATRVGSSSSTEGSFSFYVGSSAAAAVDRVYATGVESLEVTGGSGHDSLRGGSGDDILRGGDGNDLLRGDDGDDILQGGAGGDLLDIGAGVDWADGGSGIDNGSIDTSESAAPLVFNALAAATAGGLTLANGTHVRNIERWDIDSGAGDDIITVGVEGQADVNTRTGSDHLIIDHRGSTAGLFASYSTQFIVPSYLVSTNSNFELSADRIWGRGIDWVTVFGGEGGDVLSGMGLADSLHGNGGNDVLEGGAGGDTLNGGEGLDTISYAASAAGVSVNLGTNAANGGDANGDVMAGFENVTGSAWDDTLVGSIGANVMAGGAGNDVLDALNGDDALDGGQGEDTLYGRAGHDELDGGTGTDTMFGGAGDDIYRVDEASDLVAESAASGNDTVLASVSYALSQYVENLTLTGPGAANGSGNILANTLIGNSGANTLSGLAGSDTIHGAGGTDTLFGGNGNDTLNGEGDDDILDGGNDLDTLSGGDGADQLFGRTGSDTINGDAGDDAIFGGDGDDTINGGADNDVIDGNNNNDKLNGGSGADEMYGRQNNDTVNGDEGNDRVFGGDGDDQLNGGADDDLLDGGNGIDVLNGGDGADTLYGRNGVDTLDGGLGADTLYGGNDADTFVFSTALGGGNIDTVGFSVTEGDVIQLDVDVFTAINLGTLDANAFVIGAAATTADHRIIYDATTGALYYDADGDGAGAAVQFATLGTGLTLTNADFVGGP